MLIKSFPWQAPEKIFSFLTHKPSSILLDSALHNSLGQYSIVACDPAFEIELWGAKTYLIKNNKKHKLKNNFLEEVRKTLIKAKRKHPGKFPFYSGAIGYIGYEALSKTRKKPQLQIPDAKFSFFDSSLIFDHYAKKIYLASENPSNKGLGNLIKKRPAKAGDRVFKNKASNIRSNFKKNQYIKAVNEIKRYIHEGDVYQVNLSQRFETKIQHDPWVLYKRLRNISPNPFAAYLNYKEFKILSSSPERFLKLRNNRVQTRPMKGTRPRSTNKNKDEKLKTELVKSKKDSSELLMITDLLRNDLGRVCQYGSIKVKKLKILEKYSNVFQTTSLIEGKLHPSKDCIDLIKACFPGGSITGAPKIRAMEIISKLEPSARGPYTGALGYIDYSGNMDLNIIIRSIITKQNKFIFQVGGGIVADSDPKNEYEETLIKAKAIMEAISG